MKIWKKNFLNNPSIKLWAQNCEEKENNLAQNTKIKTKKAKKNELMC